MGLLRGIPTSLGYGSYVFGFRVKGSLFLQNFASLKAKRGLGPPNTCKIVRLLWLEGLGFTEGLLEQQYMDYYREPLLRCWFGPPCLERSMKWQTIFPPKP